MKHKTLLFLLLATLAIPSCGGGGSTSSSTSSSSPTSSSTPTTETSTITGVNVTPSTKQTIFVGDSFEATATVSGTGSFDQTVTWSDNNPGVISYNANQNTITITGLKEGAVKLTATSNGNHSKFATIDIEVNDVVSITDVSILPAEKQTLFVGESVYVKATVSGTGDFNRYVTWSDNNPGLVSYEEHKNNMYIVALAKGTVTLTATANGDSTKSKTLEIEVLDPVVDGVKLSISEDVIIENNNSFNISATVSGKGSYDKNVEWSSSTDGVISFGTGNTITVEGVKPGKTTLTATAKGDATKKASINITVEPDFDLTLPMVYKKVTSADELKLGEHYIILTKADDIAISPKMNSASKKFSGINVERDSKDETLIDNVIGTNVMTVKLVKGSEDGTYAFNYSNYYLQSTGSNDLLKGTTVDETTSWLITPSEDKTEIKSACEYSGNYVYLKHNISGNLFSSYPLSSSGMSEVQLYKYYSGKEQVGFDEEKIDMSTSTTKDIKLNIHGFDPKTFTWTSTDTSIVSISDDNENATLTASNKTGTVTVSCSASDGTITCSASIEINVIAYVYDQLEEGKYAIVASDNHYISPKTGNDAESFVVTDLEQYFDFAKSYTGDNKFYVKAGDKYLAKSSTQSRTCLTTTPTPWEVLKYDNNFQLITDDGVYYLTYISSVGTPWICNKTNTNNVPLVGAPTYDHMDVDSSALIKKEYNYNEPFDSTGLVVNAVYNTATGEFKKDVTSDVVWESSFGEDSIKGAVTVDGISREITVNGLTITHYDIDHITLDTSIVKTEYFVGDEVDISGLVVTATYKDGDKEKETEVDLLKCTITPEVIAISTTEITVEFEGKTASYSITVKDNRFIQTDKLREGYLVTFTANSREMNGDGFNSTEFSSFPVGEAVFEVKRDELEYPNWRFKLVEVKNEEYSGNIGKYLAVDTSSKALLKLVSDIDTTNTVFTVEFYNESSPYAGAVSMHANGDNQNDVCMNEDSYKFAAKASSLLV